MTELRKRDLEVLAAVDRGDPVPWDLRFHSAWLVAFHYLKVDMETGKIVITPKGKTWLPIDPE